MLNLSFLEAIAAAYLGEPVKLHIEHMPGVWGTAWLDGGDGLHISLAQTLPEDQAPFTFFHEVGHLALKHVKKPLYEQRGIEEYFAESENAEYETEIRAEYERREAEADAFATKELARLYTDHGIEAIKAFWR